VIAQLAGMAAAIAWAVALMRWLTARRRAKSRLMNELKGPPEPISASTMQVAFICASCGQTAGRVQLLLPGESPTDRSRPALALLADLDPILRARAGNPTTLVVETFFGVQSQPVNPELLQSVAQAIREQDASALYELGYSNAPFHCPQCKLSYCGEHWKWNRFEDEYDINGIEGTCPRGHFHVLTY
jgi:hypothetical protein